VVGTGRLACCQIANHPIPPALILVTPGPKWYKPFRFTQTYSHPRSSRLRISAMLKAYLDESGSDDTPFLLVGGYVSTETRWKKFERAWVEALHSEGLHESFHMVDFETGSGEFRGPEWTSERKDRLFRRLAQIIARHPILEVSAGVSLGDFNEAIERIGKQVNPNLRTPYALCVLLCILHIERWAREDWHRGEVALVFDQGRKFTGQILQWYKQAALWGQLGERHKIASFGPDDRRRAIPLQAADVFTHLIFRTIKTRALQGFIDPVVKKRLRSLQHMRSMGGFLDTETVGWWIQSLNSEFFTRLLKNR